MKSKIWLLSGGIVAAIGGPIVAVSATINQEQQLKRSVYNDSLYFYDGYYFDDYDQILKYYLRKYPWAINNKLVIGDIANSVIDFDYGMLSKNKLFDYDEDKIKPVYYTNNGIKTDVYDDAASSYAHRGLIETFYQGVTDLFADQTKAKEDREKNMLNMYLTYFNMPQITNSSSDFKYNPLNQDDLAEYLNNFLLYLQNSNSVFNVKDYQKEIDWTEAGGSLLANTSYEYYENQNAAQPDLPGLTKRQTVDDPLIRTVGEDFDEDAIMHDTKNYYRNETNIWFYPFKGLVEEDEAKFWTLVTAGEKMTDGQTDTKDLAPRFYPGQAEKVVVIDELNAEKLLNDQKEALITILSTLAKSPESYPDDPDNDNGNVGKIYKSIYNLNDAQIWLDFKKEALAKINSYTETYGSNFTYQIEVSLDKDKYQAGLSGRTDNLVRHWYDDNSSEDDTHVFHYIDLTYLNFAINFKFQIDEASPLVNLTKRFNSYYNEIVNHDGHSWDQAPSALLYHWLDNPVWFDEQGTSVSYSLKSYEQTILNNLKAAIQQKTAIFTLPETVYLRQGSEKTKLLQIEREQIHDDQWRSKIVRVKHQNDYDRHTFLDAFWEVIKNDINDEKNDQKMLLGEDNIKPKAKIAMNDYTIYSVMMTILDFLLGDAQQSTSIKPNEPKLTSNVKEGEGEEEQEEQEAAIWNDWASFKALWDQEPNWASEEEIASKLKIPSYSEAFYLLSQKDKWEYTITLGYSSPYREQLGKSIFDPILNLLNSLAIYLKHNQDSLVDDLENEFLKNSNVLKKARFNLNNLIIPTNNGELLNESGDGYQSNFESVSTSSGKYLLLLDAMFNSSLMLVGGANLGNNGVFLNEEAYDQHREQMIKSDPPVVRVLLDIEGRHIMGDPDEDGQSLVYDSIEVILINAKNQAKVRWDPDHVYYFKSKNKPILIDNQIGNIYTLNTNPEAEESEIYTRYFKSFLDVKNYLLESLKPYIVVLTN